MKLLAPVLSALMFITTAAFAETPKVCTTPLAVTVPCSGVLLPPDAASKGLQCLKVDLPKLQLDLEFAGKRHELEVLTLNKLIAAEKNRAVRIEGLLDKSLAHVDGPKWYEHPIFWTAVGLVVGAGATVGIAYAIAPAAK